MTAASWHRFLRARWAQSNCTAFDGRRQKLAAAFGVAGNIADRRPALCVVQAIVFVLVEADDEFDFGDSIALAVVRAAAQDNVCLERRSRHGNSSWWNSVGLELSDRRRGPVENEYRAAGGEFG